MRRPISFLLIAFLVFAFPIAWPFVGVLLLFWILRHTFSAFRSALSGIAHAIGTIFASMARAVGAMFGFLVDHPAVVTQPLFWGAIAIASLFALHSILHLGRTALTWTPLPLAFAIVGAAVGYAVCIPIQDRGFRHAPALGAIALAVVAFFAAPAMPRIVLALAVLSVPVLLVVYRRNIHSWVLRFCDRAGVRIGRRPRRDAYIRDGRRMTQEHERRMQWLATLPIDPDKRRDLMRTEHDRFTDSVQGLHDRHPHHADDATTAPFDQWYEQSQRSGEEQP